MRYERTASFKADYKKLSDAEQLLFRKAALEFAAASERMVEDPTHAWPSSLRVKSVRGAPGVWEMTWSFSGPDGRATWEWTTVEIEDDAQTTRTPAIRWRRVGNHSIFSDP